jgi:hypothetical protein
MGTIQDRSADLSVAFSVNAVPLFPSIENLTKQLRRGHGQKADHLPGRQRRYKGDAP